MEKAYIIDENDTLLNAYGYQLLVFNYLGVGKMSNVSSTFILKFIILGAKFVPFFSFNWFHASVDFIIISKWSSLANFVSTFTFKW